MPPRRRKPRPDPPPTGLLNWGSPEHWSTRQLPCRYCGDLTNLRDSHRKPAHKVCAEDALRQQTADAADAYEIERLT